LEKDRNEKLPQDNNMKSVEIFVGKGGEVSATAQSKRWMLRGTLKTYLPKASHPMTDRFIEPNDF
jgi:hypothetical protein